MENDASPEGKLNGAPTADEILYVRRQKIPLRTKLAFSVGAIQEGMLVAAHITTMIFYNQVLGASLYHCGVAFLVASIVDAVSDPLVGALSDRFRSRWGRRHPFMLASAFPLAVSIYFLYQPMGGLSENGLFIWLMTWFVLLRLAYTFYNIPHDALGAELTDDYHERTSLFGYNHVAHSGSSVLLSFFIFLVLFASTPEYSNGLLNEERYSLLALIGAITVFTAVMVSTIGTRDRIPFLYEAHSDLPGAKEYFKNVSRLVTNRSYLSVCFSWLIIATTIGILTTVSTYTYLYAYELSTEQLSISGFAKFPGIVAALPLATLMTRMFDKKYSVIIATLISGFLIALPHLLRMAGGFPDNESVFLLPMLYVPLFLGYIILPVMYIVVDSQLVDICDDHEYRTGTRAEGVVFSVRTFSMKATHGLGAMIGAFGLGIINFPDNAAEEGLTPEVVDGLLFINGPLYLILMVLGAVCMAFYQINAKRHKEILATLEKRLKTQT